jgi:catechol 2,3-dioxygenase-like lactoylglutathione lyase family enzyme
MDLERIDHIGVVVEDLDEAAQLLGEGLGLRVGTTINRDDLHAVFFQCGDVSIEVIEIQDADARRARLGDACRARIEHIAIEVRDLGDTLRALEALGIRSTAEPRRSADAMTFWTAPDTSNGIMFQFLARDPPSGLSPDR